ncbi:MAG: hypothetical protein II917_01590 [Synergistaceae bacterium]|nr:hypothetical protein [Synergistaceae bacterium]
MFSRELIEQVNSQMVSGASCVIPQSVRSYIERKTPQEISDALSHAWRKNATKDKLAHNLERLNDIAQLESDWNGYGAAPFSQALIAEARNIITNLTEQPELFPTGRESIQLEYELPDKSYLEFEIFEDKIAAMQVSGTDYDNARFWDLSPDDIKQVRGIVKEFFDA